MSDALLEAIEAHNVDRVAELLAAGADPNEGKSRDGYWPLYPLHAALMELEAIEDEPAGPIDTVILLLRHGARVNGWDISKEGDPLLIAVWMNHIEAARLLLAAGADPNIRDDEGYWPLLVCAEKGFLEIARLLLHCGAGKTIYESGGGGQGMNALGFAVRGLHVEMVRLLLAHGADPSVPDVDGLAAFELLRYAQVPDSAARERFEEICRLLGATPSTYT